MDNQHELAEAPKSFDKGGELDNQSLRLLGENFSLAVDCLYTASGKIVVSGIGKSGHLGKKLAATFCSTGSPAAFLHPSEAVHGDLGIHQEGDPVVIFVQQRITPELLALVPLLKK